MLLAEIFKWRLADCSNGGISSRCSTVTIVNAEGPIKEPTDDAPAVLLERRDIRGDAPILTFFPAALRGGVWVRAPGWWMMGGSYIATPDSGMGELCRKLGVPFYGAVAFHDRTEA